MSYSKSSSEKFTLIDDLLDLDDPNEQSNFSYKNILPNGQEDKFGKFIRQPHKSKYQDSTNNNIQNTRENNGYENNMHGNTHSSGYGSNGYQNNIHGDTHSSGYGSNSYQNNMHGHTHSNNGYNTQEYFGIPNNSPYSCLDVAGHFDNCPLCSKFYNNDMSVYIISIVILIIVCIILLKKVLDK